MAASKETLTYSLGCILGIIIAISWLGLEAYVITQMWLWHVVPLGMPAISFLHAMALDLLVFFCFRSEFHPHQIAKEYRHPESELNLGLRAAVFLYGRPLLVLGIGYLLYILR